MVQLVTSQYQGGLHPLVWQLIPASCTQELTKQKYDSCKANQFVGPFVFFPLEIVIHELFTTCQMHIPRSIANENTSKESVIFLTGRQACFCYQCVAMYHRLPVCALSQAFLASGICVCILQVNEVSRWQKALRKTI